MPFPTPTSGLTPYTGPFSNQELTHLLKRTLFGAKKTDVDFFYGKTLDQVLNVLLDTNLSLPSPPVKDYVVGSAANPDNNILMGSTWISDYNTDGTINSLRISSFKKWWVGVMIQQSRNVTEKMILFLHNHFATQTASISNANYVYTHHSLLRKYALGNFRDLVKQITVDPGMLVYLNGQYNTAAAPDENYARELQELFCCGKGPNSLYTEADVKAAAKVLTGWRNNAALNNSYFTSSIHDSSSKQFSSFYNNTIIVGKTGSTAGTQEIDALVTMLFSTDEVAKYICRCIYRWFVYYNIDSTIENNIITPLAVIFKNSNFELVPVLRTLLQSQHFFDVLNRGCQIKSPVDLVIGLCREYEVAFPAQSDYISNYGLNNYIVGWLNTLNQNIGDPPNVSGWAAYYQEPQFYEVWISSDTLPKRNQFTDTLILSGITYNGKKIIIDPLTYVSRFSDPSDPNALLNEALLYLYKVQLSSQDIDQIKKDILLSGQITDSYWTDAWNLYITQPSNTANTNNVKSKLTNLFKYLMNLSEYQLS